MSKPKILIYLAGPYSQDGEADATTKLQRFVCLTELAVSIMKLGKGEIGVFSPITHSHQLAIMGVHQDSDWWLAIDKRLQQTCDELWVYCLTGWTSSKGVQKEISLAKRLNQTARYLYPGDNLQSWIMACVEKAMSDFAERKEVEDVGEEELPKPHKRAARRRKVRTD